MKKIISLISITALSCASVFGQDAVQKAAEAAVAEMSQAPEVVEQKNKPKYWDYSLQFNLGFNTTTLKNWAAGGFNTFTGTANIDAKADYSKDNMSWNNRLQLDYGLLESSDKEGVIQKSNDRMYLESKWAYKAATSSKFSLTAGFDFRSQFTDTPAGYVQAEDGKWNPDGLKSGFLAPAYTNIALGIQWAPASWFDVNIAPLTGGFTICTNEILRKSYGMKLISDDLDAALGSSYRSTMFQLGAQVKANLKLAINDNITYETQGVVFTDYLSEPYFRINWDNSLNIQLSKLMKFAVKTWLIYDPNIIFTDENGVESKKVQFKDFISFNFTYTFTHKK